MNNLMLRFSQFFMVVICNLFIAVEGSGRIFKLHKFVMSDG